MRMLGESPPARRIVAPIAALAALAAGILAATLLAGESDTARAAGGTRTVYVTRVVHAVPIYEIRGPRVTRYSSAPSS